MTKHITVKLTGDQLDEVILLLGDDIDCGILKPEHEAFAKRLKTKFEKALAQAKTK